MKVLMINGSPHANGCTCTALTEVRQALEAEGIAAQWLDIGKKPVQGCTACGGCRGNGRCVLPADGVNEAIDRMKDCDALVVGSPVYYSSPNGSLLAFLDRMFYAGARGMAYKPGASVVSARRAGTTASLDVLNKYFLISNMPVVPSQYWNMVHGNTPDEVRQDLEGMQIMRTLGRNLAWMLRCIAAGGPPPEMQEKRVRTNFIR